ncbi:histidine--tRNA ligase [Candidatus Phytoplasma palmae]|uniref:histidine--tRNA ligase n=1 Tax=Candidatus Phytoplasma palmae TaxID=85624 RepID=UPI00399051D2
MKKIQKINKIKGTKDLIFEELEKWKFVENKAKELFSKYNFHEIRTPILEYNEVFYRSNQFSDMVMKETFKFKDKKDRILVLRPEGTASIVRSYIENKLNYLEKTYKFFYIGPFFRYERPQKGRYRQFHQIGAETLNLKNFLSEIEIILLIQDFLRIFNLENALIKINTLGDKNTRDNFLNVFYPYIEKNKQYLCNLCLNRMEKNILRIFDCKKCREKEFFQKTPVILDFLSEDSFLKFEKTTNILKNKKINFQIDPKLVRGLDYYNDLVFEIIIPSYGKEIVLGGGGSYNELISLFGGKNSNSIGFAFGLERLVEILDEQNFFKHLNKKNNLDVFLLVLEEQFLLKSFDFLYKLRKNKIISEMNYNNFHFEKNFKKILKEKPKYIIFIGKKEIQNNKLTIKKINTDFVYTLNEKETIEFLIKELSSEK